MSNTMYGFCGMNRKTEIRNKYFNFPVDISEIEYIMYNVNSK